MASSRIDVTLVPTGELSNMPDDLFPENPDRYFVQVFGNDYAEQGFGNEDCAYFSKSKEPQHGDLILARHNDEYSLRVYDGAPEELDIAVLDQLIEIESD